MEELSIILPVRGTIVGRFGEVYNAGTPNAYRHRGLDIAAPEGTPIVAPCDGEVVDFYNDGSFGPYAICLYHVPSDLYLLLAHGRRSLVTVGQRVRQGQQIGEVGMLGTATGPHCHFQISVAKTFPIDISYSRDPLSFLVTEEDMEAIEDIKAMLVGNGFDAICYPGTEDLFPAGTTVTLEGQDGPNYRLTGENAFQYAKRRGFSLALAAQSANVHLAQHASDGHGGKQS